MYDGNHTNESYYNALLYYYNCLDVFIFYSRSLESAGC